MIFRIHPVSVKLLWSFWWACWMTCELWVTCISNFIYLHQSFYWTEHNQQLTEEGKKLWLRMTSHSYATQRCEWQHQAVMIHSLGTEIASVQRKRITFEQRNALSNREYRHYRVINHGSHPESRFNCRISCRGKLELQLEAMEDSR